MNPSHVIHYRNKYPGGRVEASEDRLDVYDASGAHCVALRKNGAGGWSDVSEMLGCKHSHDLAPIPKDARVQKLQDGKIGLDEKAEERKKAREQFIEDGRVLSVSELEKKGHSFDKEQRLISK